MDQPCACWPIPRCLLSSWPSRYTPLPTTGICRDATPTITAIARVTAKLLSKLNSWNICQELIYNFAYDRHNLMQIIPVISRFNQLCSGVWPGLRQFQLCSHWDTEIQQDFLLVPQPSAEVSVLLHTEICPSGSHELNIKKGSLEKMTKLYLIILVICGGSTNALEIRRG